MKFNSEMQDAASPFNDPSSLKPSLRSVSIRSLFLLCVAAVLAHSQTAKPKMNIAVLPLSAQGVDSASAQVLTDALADEILNTGKVRVMERSQMAEVLKEQGFQSGGSCDQSECAIMMGKLLGIEKIVVGSVGKFGNSHTLTLRGVNVATGEIEVSVRRIQKGDIEAVLSDLLPSLAQDLSAQLVGEKPSKSLPKVAFQDSSATGSIPPSVRRDTLPAGKPLAKKPDSSSLAARPAIAPATPVATPVPELDDRQKLHQGPRILLGVTAGLNSLVNPLVGFRLGAELSGISFSVGWSPVSMAIEEQVKKASGVADIGLEYNLNANFGLNGIGVQYCHAKFDDNDFTEYVVQYQRDIGDPGDFYFEIGAGLLKYKSEYWSTDYSYDYSTYSSTETPVYNSESAQFATVHVGFMYRFF